MGFKLNSDLNQPFYGGGGSATLVPTVVDAALGGHPYRIDWSADIPLNYESINDLRPQSDQSDSPGEQSINPESFWRRSSDSWHVGAGQRHYDRADSNRNRFWNSKGINIWERFQLSALKLPVGELIASATNLKLIVVGTHLYLTNGTSIQYWTDVTGGSQTDITGEPANQATSIVSDGFNVFTAHGTNGIYKTTRGAATTASHITGTVNLLGWARGRFLATSGTTLYDATTIMYGAGGVAISTATSLLVHPNTDWTWTSITEGSSYIYAAGYSGDKSLIYRIHIKEDGTGLDAPIVAAELPDGEVIRTIYGYLGKFLLIGTDQGFRFAIQATGGDLSVGALVSTPAPVLCFEGQREFVWFGWGNFDGSSTGLGRLSTATFSDPDALVPAYASDLMVDGQTNNVTSIVTFQDRTMFTVDQIAFYYEGTDLVAEGFLDSGLISFNLTEEKIGLFINAQHSGTTGMHEVEVAVDEGAFVSLGTHESGVVFNLGQAVGMNFEIRNILHRGTPTTAGLTIHSWMLRVEPKPETTSYIFTTIFLVEHVESLVDSWLYFDVFAEMDFIANLNKTKEITTWQIGNRSDAVIVEGYRVMAKEVMENSDSLNASCALKLKKVL